MPVVIVCSGSLGMAAALCLEGDMVPPMDRGWDGEEGLDTAPVVTVLVSSRVELYDCGSWSMAPRAAEGPPGTRSNNKLTEDRVDEGRESMGM